MTATLHPFLAKLLHLNPAASHPAARLDVQRLGRNQLADLNLPPGFRDRFVTPDASLWSSASHYRTL